MNCSLLLNLALTAQAGVVYLNCLLDLEESSLGKKLLALEPSLFLYSTPGRTKFQRKGTVIYMNIRITTEEEREAEQRVDEKDNEEATLHM